MTDSPHSSSRQGTIPDVCILHFTAGAGTAKSTAEFMERTENSAHCIVGRDGEREHPVPVGRAAWHAGDHNKARTSGSRLPSPEQLRQLSFRGTPIPFDQVEYASGAVNRRSYGIEMVNLGYSLEKKEGWYQGRHRNPGSRAKYWQPYTTEQMEALADEMLYGLPDSVAYYCGHEDVTNRYTVMRVGGKLDPGPAFDWGWLKSRVSHRLTRLIFDFQLKAWRLDVP